LQGGLQLNNSREAIYSIIYSLWVKTLVENHLRSFQRNSSIIADNS